MKRIICALLLLPITLPLALIGLLCEVVADIITSIEIWAEDLFQKYLD